MSAETYWVVELRGLSIGVSDRSFSLARTSMLLALPIVKSGALGDIHLHRIFPRIAYHLLCAVMLLKINELYDQGAGDYFRPGKQCLLNRAKA
jgi:hypothetical protein